MQHIFSKNLFRPINGVVKADQQDDAIVWQELDEYVVTNELDEHFRKFFESYLTSITNGSDPNIASQIGVWVSGFFGSGKSHFIKILSYLLNNRIATAPSLDSTHRAVDFFDSKIKDPMLLANIKRCTSNDTDVILFNIDSRADSNSGRGAILSVFWRVFNEMQGFSGDDPHIAEMERYLTENDKYEAFCTHYQKLTGDNWVEERDAYYFHRDELIEALSKTLDQSLESATAWFDNAENTLSVTIENFAKRVKEYLDRKGPKHRIVFLVDEIGQFIGSDGNLMLNLQTITEDLGRLCQGRAWVIVTSQEDIDSVLGDLKASKANDFSKIQGRFTTRLSLSSSNTDEVIQARLLEKTPEASSELESLFNAKGDIIRSQLDFTHDCAAMRTFTDKQDFVGNYPFAPYHFQLIQKIFESIRKAGATGMHLSRGERSMLDAFQSAAKNICTKDIGALVPLYEFYPAIESFLDTAVSRTIDQAASNDGLEKPFDVHLLQTLFLIRYVDIVKPNVDNLVTLFIDQVDADRLALKRKIEEGLQRLEKQTLISRNGDLYFFLTNEERDVSRAIQNVDITSSDETKLLEDVMFTEILRDQSKHRYKPYKRDYAYSRLLDGHPFGTKLDQEIGVEIITPLFFKHDVFNSSKCTMYTSEHYGRVLIRLQDSKDLGEEVRSYLQTRKYIRQENDASQSNSFKKILSDKQDENRERRKRITLQLEKLLVDADVYAMGQALTLKASTPRVLVEEALNYIVENLYNKFSYLKKLEDDPVREIRSVLLSNDVSQMELEKGLTTVNADAIHEVRVFIDLQVGRNHPVLLNELVDRFGSKPYGWPEFEIVLLVARLLMAGEINLLSDGSSLEPRDAVAPMTKVNKWKTIKIMKRKVPSKDQIEKARKLCQTLFGKNGPEALDDLERTIRNELGDWQESLKQYQPLAQTGKFPGNSEIADGLATIRSVLNIRDTFEFINRFNDKQEDLQDASDDLHDLKDFYTNQRPTWEKLLSALDEFEKNETALNKDADAEASLKQLRTIAEAPAPYGMLKDVDTHVSKVTAINDTLVADKRQKAMLELDAKIVLITKELEAMKADDEFRNHVLYPLQQTKLAIEQDTSIPNISYRMEGFQETVDEALDAIERKKQPEPVKPGEDPDPVKQTKIVKATSVASKAYIESPEDVDAYVTALKKTLLTELKNNVRIRLQ